MRLVYCVTGIICVLHWALWIYVRSFCLLFQQAAFSVDDAFVLSLCFIPALLAARIEMAAILQSVM